MNESNMEEEEEGTYLSAPSHASSSTLFDPETNSPLPDTSGTDRSIGRYTSFMEFFRRRSMSTSGEAETADKPDKTDGGEFSRTATIRRSGSRRGQVSTPVSRPVVPPPAPPALRPVRDDTERVAFDTFKTADPVSPPPAARVVTFDADPERSPAVRPVRDDTERVAFDTAKPPGTVSYTVVDERDPSNRRGLYTAPVPQTTCSSTYSKSTPPPSQPAAMVMEEDRISRRSVSSLASYYDKFFGGGRGGAKGGAVGGSPARVAEPSPAVVRPVRDDTERAAFDAATALQPPDTVRPVRDDTERVAFDAAVRDVRDEAQYVQLADLTKRKFMFNN